MPMKNPPHPGRIVRQDCIEPLGLTVTAAAKALGITRQALNNLVNGKAGISPEMAVRISKAFGGSPEVWLRLQANYDLARFDRTKSAPARFIERCTPAARTEFMIYPLPRPESRPLTGRLRSRKCAGIRTSAPRPGHHDARRSSFFSLSAKKTLSRDW